VGRDDCLGVEFGQGVDGGVDDGFVGRRVQVKAAYDRRDHLDAGEAAGVADAAEDAACPQPVSTTSLWSATLTTRA
jgi:hypothetical protein